MTKKRKLITVIMSLVMMLGFGPLANACHTSAINKVTVVNNGNGTYTFTINLFINVGSLDGYDYGFALIFTGSKGTPVVQSGFTAKVTTPQDQLNGFTGSKIGTQAEAMTTRAGVVDRMLPYIETQLARHGGSGLRLNSVTRHMLGLMAGMPGARAFRQTLSDSTRLAGRDPRLLLEAMGRMQLVDLE